MDAETQMTTEQPSTTIAGEGATTATPGKDITAYKMYIRKHALTYVGPVPHPSDPSYDTWQKKLQKVEAVLHKKYLKKLALTLQHQQNQLRNTTIGENSSDRRQKKFAASNIDAAAEILIPDMHKKESSPASDTPVSSSSERESTPPPPTPYVSPFRSKPRKKDSNEQLVNELRQQVARLEYFNMNIQQMHRQNCQRLAFMNERCQEQQMMLTALKLQNNILQRRLAKGTMMNSCGNAPMLKDSEVVASEFNMEDFGEWMLNAENMDGGMDNRMPPCGFPF